MSTELHAGAVSRFTLQLPDYIAPLQEEMKTVIFEEGWTKSALGKIYSLDSFLREFQRLTGLGSCVHQHPC